MPDRTARQFVAGRIFGLVLGGTGVIWGLAVFPTFWQQWSIERVAARVIAAERFSMNALVQLIPAAEAAEKAEMCRPEVVRSAAIIRLRLVEEAIGTGLRQSIDARMNELVQSVRSSLACSPADPFLWLVLYWVENTRSGVDDKHIEYLRMSDLLGPNEGWVAIKRNRFALAIFEHLPPISRTWQLAICAPAGERS